MEGRGQLAIDAARKAARIPAPKLQEVPILEGFVVVPYYALVRFRKWDEILGEPEPAHGGPLLRGVRHYARGVALTATGKLDEAAGELARLRALGEDPAVAKLTLWSGNSVRTVLAIAAEALAGELASGRGQPEAAIAHFARAVRLEDSLTYTEPSDWHYPMRQSLGAALRRAGRNDEAEVVYWEDLRRHPENGWSLHGLMLSLRAQGKTELAAEIEARFRKAWSRADVPPDTLG
jgi:tetratricopeptide (TPR) repeat protein